MGLYYYSIFFWSQHGSINQIELYFEIWNQTLLFTSSQEPLERDLLATFYIAQRANHTRLEFAKTRGHEISLP